MQYNIFGNNLPGVSIILDKGEQVFTQSGGMIWMDASIKMDSNLKGGVFQSIGRMFTGESLFMVTYTAREDNSEVVFGSTFPGEILPISLSGRDTIIAQKDAFLCAEHDVKLEITFTKKLSSGFFGGEGFILQKISGNGMVFLESTGCLVERELARGETILVDTGNVTAFESSVAYEIEFAKGMKNMLFGGEGLFLTKLTGPGKVWLQTITVDNVANRIIPFIPVNNS
ncbi:TIGR00266 family protein [Candidatus Epulonipiscium fishelsonii]|uniref:TIGR00266 family protein n=1 Tax=Candidatus Epulonipiscium fishelsonii TaxID=77094 RepID=A0ACC8XFA5_9FIRM|nr:TIGR00266 family protein [Epulopiscium sp. SCG-B11WGA-EpuloA1]